MNFISTIAVLALAVVGGTNAAAVADVDSTQVDNVADDPSCTSNHNVIVTQVECVQKTATGCPGANGAVSMQGAVTMYSFESWATSAHLPAQTFSDVVWITSLTPRQTVAADTNLAMGVILETKSSKHAPSKKSFEQWGQISANTLDPDMHMTFSDNCFQCTVTYAVNDAGTQDC
eukprot:Clim_evm4s14 gene=Clim_evmTU4s14